MSLYVHIGISTTGNVGRHARLLYTVPLVGNEDGWRYPAKHAI